MSYYGYNSGVCAPGCLVGDYHNGPCVNEEDLEMDEWFLAVFAEEAEHPVEDCDE